MKEYSINIREIAELMVYIEANTEEEALMKAEEEWKNGKYIIDDSCFKSAEFTLCGNK